DRFDRLLLNILQEDASLTAEQLAERVPMSSSAIQRRLRRLRDDKVIERDIAVLSPKACGRPLMFIVSVTVERETPDRMANFRRWLNRQPNIQQVFYVTGDTDYILVVVAPDAETYDDLTARMVGDNPNVKRFTTQVVLNALKRGLTIPLVEAD
ncbi:Lrp/AsnC family transcriptional regulator, partial [Escherichia coli]|nr:Lrp/AsnC family transcriptional regulator [Escherichia coli]